MLPSEPTAIATSIYDLVDGGLLVAGAGNDVLVVRRDVAAKDRGRLLRLQEDPEEGVIDVKDTIDKRLSVCVCKKG
jgi:hypothetical protein